MADSIDYPFASREWVKQRHQALDVPGKMSWGDWLDNLGQLAKYAVMGRGGVGDAMERLVPLFRGESGTGKQLSKAPEWLRQGVEQHVIEGRRPPHHAEGRWFGPPEEAQWYLKDASDPVLKQVMVPESLAEASRVSRLAPDLAKFSQRPDREYLLPPEMIKRAQVVPGPQLEKILGQ